MLKDIVPVTIVLVGNHMYVVHMLCYMIHVPWYKSVTYLSSVHQLYILHGMYHIDSKTTMSTK